MDIPKRWIVPCTVRIHTQNPANAIHAERMRSSHPECMHHLIWHRFGSRASNVRSL
jgi:hypothetical protein